MEPIYLADDEGNLLTDELGNLIVIGYVPAFPQADAGTLVSPWRRAAGGGRKVYLR